ncbi:MAG: IclR family transcriptional regulator [Nocardioides sp.]|uniref:IclR family transcriptional regulator n=1 Tax=Nocardioides sp. TaxID=35761 RepID=UPI003F074EFF
MAAEPTALPASMIERMTLIIDTIGGGQARLEVDTLVRRTGLPRSTVRRILDQLVKLHWVAEHPDGYGVGHRFGGAVADDRGHADIRAAAAPHLHRLHVATGLVAHLAKHTGAEVFYLDKVGGPGAASIPSRVGGRAPLHATALGKAVLAWWQPEQVEEVLAAGMARLTHRTIADIATLHEELSLVRGRRGVAYERGEHTPQVSCVAAAVRTPAGVPVAVVSMSGRELADVERAAPLVLDAALRISKELYPSVRERGEGGQTAAPERETWTPQMLDRLMQRGHGDWI